MSPNDSSSYTHGYHASVMRSHSNRTIANSAQYMESELREGRSLLDVGSGRGTVTAEFAQRLGVGCVTALEMEDASMALTRSEIARHRGMDVAFVVGDVHQLPFEDGTFDIVHAHQVLQHVREPVQALREMYRVCKPGGVVAARDSDYAGFIWTPELPALDHWMTLYQKANRANGGEPNAGRYLLGWAQEAGCTDIVATSSTWCLANDADRAWWGGMWAERILVSKIATQLLEARMASREELVEISSAWEAWAKTPDGWMSLVHGEILCRKPA